MLNSILVGTLLTIVTVAIHASGTTQWIQHLTRRAKAIREEQSRWSPTVILGSTATVLLLLHILEVAVWALAYLALVDSIRDLEQATYFSTVTFSSLGYGDIVIQGPWRLLSAIEAMTGLLIFGWSTALLFAVVQRIWNLPPQKPTDE